VNIPIALTLSRILSVPVLISLLELQSAEIGIGGFVIASAHLALAVFVLAALTDLLDGYLARRWRHVTLIGAVLDTFADRLLICGTLIALVQVNSIPSWMVILVVAREFAVYSLRVVASSRGYNIQISDLGRAKTFSLIVAVSCALLSRSYPALRLSAEILLMAGILFALWSALEYLREFRRKLDPALQTGRSQEQQR
jgi:CDP-diacylglycerol--glycerol-3-phosphate 3-phosphatidyltransferase